MIAGLSHNFKDDDEEIEIVQDLFLGSIKNPKGDGDQEIKRLKLGRAAAKKLGKIFKREDVSLGSGTR